MAELTRPTFRKQERIVSKRLMEQLFAKGSSQSATAFPLRAVYQLRERPAGEPPVQVLVSVSKRHFKRAVKRNRVKRQIREAYRHHKQAAAQCVPGDKQMLLAFIWLADELAESRRVEKAVARLIEKIAERLCVTPSV